MATSPEQFRGVGVDAFFRGAPKTTAPFPSAGRRKDVQDFDPALVDDAVRAGETSPVDPTTLHATQPWVTLSGVRHYAEGKEGTFADQGKAGNRHPVVYHRETDMGTTSMLLSGHHRATAALLQGKQLDAIQVRGGWGPKRGQ